MLNKEFKPLLELLPRECKLFRTTSKSSFGNNYRISDVLIFDYKYGCREVYVKYSDVDYFIEMTTGGMSSDGKMKTLSISDAWENSYCKDSKIHINDNNMMLVTGSENNFFEFIGEIKIDMFTKIVTNITASEENKKYFENIFMMNYLELPRNMMYISYAYKSEGLNPVYFLIYHPTYYFSYDNFNVVVIEDLKKNIFKKLDVDKVERYKDGGTTNICCKGNWEFYFPTPFAKDSYATFNGMKIVKVNDEEYDKFKEILMKNGFEVEEKI